LFSLFPDTPASISYLDYTGNKQPMGCEDQLVVQQIYVNISYDDELMTYKPSK